MNKLMYRFEATMKEKKDREKARRILDMIGSQGILRQKR